MEQKGEETFELLNFGTGKEITVNYPLILLYGRIIESGSSSIKPLPLTLCFNDTDQEDNGFISSRRQPVHNEFDQVLCVSVVGNSVNMQCNKSPEFKLLHCQIIHNQFKVFVHLKPGVNKIILSKSGGYSNHEVTITYEPMHNKRYVRPVYIICKNSDGKFDAPDGETNSVESALARIATNARLLQTFTAENLYSHRLGRKTFRLEENENGDVKVNVFNSKLEFHEALNMSGDELYGAFEKELGESALFDPLCKFWVFMSCTRYCPPSSDEYDASKIASYVKAHTALGGGNMALFGTGSLHTWAENVEELRTRFTDERKIDKMALFDDSCGRGFYWANYSTTLGASMHELGHCFNLAHTPNGIMGRGFDDMNKFFTVHDKEPNLEKECHHNPFKDGGAHWHRPSAVVLNLSKWIGNRTDSVDQGCLPMVYCDSNTRGPVGNNGPSCQKDQIAFDSKEWLTRNNLTFGGVIVSAEKYVNYIQIIGYQLSSSENDHDTVMVTWLSPNYGSEKQKTDKRIIFALESPKEHINRLEVRAGAWIDGLRIHSNLKSSIWIGGSGGDLHELRVLDGRWFDTVFGTAGRYLGSIGVTLNSEKETCISNKDDCYHFDAPNGVQHIEVRDKRGEIIKHWEYLDSDNNSCVNIPREELMLNGKTTCIMLVDGQGLNRVVDLSFEKSKDAPISALDS